MFHFYWSSYNIPDSGVNEYLPTNISNSDVGKCCVTQKVRYSWLWRQWINSQKIELNETETIFSFFIIFFVIYVARSQNFKKKGSGDATILFDSFTHI
jgi:hypothetical protein